MKKLSYICLLAVAIISACNKKEPISDKIGIRLPAVSNLAIQQVADSEVKLSWTNPTDIPAEITQPIRIFIETKEIRGVMQSFPVPELTVTLENAPTEMTFTLPDKTKEYIFTVKANGTANVTDVRYTNNIFSVGQSVSYTP